MTRKKVRLAYIANDSARKATFKKRRRGFMKKVSELSTLCGIDACAIVYSPYEPEPDVCPADPVEAQRIVDRFRTMPEMDQCKKMANQESFIRERIAKAGDQLKKLSRDNREKEIAQLMYQCLTGRGLHGLAVPELRDIDWLLDRNLREIETRIGEIKKAREGSSSEVLEEKPKVVENGGGGVDVGRQWFTEVRGSSAFMHGVGGVGEEIGTPFSVGNASHPTMWSNVFFP